MATLPDGTIEQTVHKQAGHGPYLWCCVWIDGRTRQQNISVYSFWQDAAAFRDAIQANGHEAQIDLAVDNMRRVPAGTYHLPALEVSL
jgi:hypothetical protein